MADRWCKLLTRTRTSGKIMEACDLAGPAAWALYSGLLMLHAEFGERGRIPPTHCDLRNLRSNLPAFGMKVQDFSDALEALRTADLIQTDDSGSIAILGWDDDVAPQCSQCRKPNHVPKYATCEDCRSKLRNLRKAGRESPGGSTSSGDHPEELANDWSEFANSDDKLADGSTDVSRKEKEKEKDGDSTSPKSMRPHNPETIHSESAAAAVELSLMGVERQTASYASTSQPIPAGDILQGIFRRGAV